VGTQRARRPHYESGYGRGRSDSEVPRNGLRAPWPADARSDVVLSDREDRSPSVDEVPARFVDGVEALAVHGNTGRVGGGLDESAPEVRRRVIWRVSRELAVRPRIVRRHGRVEWEGRFALFRPDEEGSSGRGRDDEDLV